MLPTTTHLLYGRQEFLAWLDRMSRHILGIGAEDFADRYRRGEYIGVPVAEALASAIPFAGLDQAY